MKVNDRVFAGVDGRPLSYTGFALAPKRAGIDAAGPHSWRAIFRIWCAKIAHVDGDVAEIALAHMLDETKRAYFQDSVVERRRGVMTDYAGWLTGDAEDNVVAFKRA